jgi:hypothetical protein
MLASPIGRWILAVFLALALVGLLAYARGEPGDDGRAPDPEAAIAAAVDDASGAGTARG